MRRIEAIIVHHSGGFAEDTSNGKQLAELTTNKQHLLTRGIKSPAEYHVIIARNGDTLTLAQDEQILGHCGDDNWNIKSLAICVEGNISQQGLTKKQYESLLSMVLFWCRTYNLNIKNIYKHSAVMATDCPGSRFPWDKMSADIIYSLKASPQIIELKLGSKIAHVFYFFDSHPYEKNLTVGVFLSWGVISWLSKKDVVLLGAYTTPSQKYYNKNDNIKIRDLAKVLHYQVIWNAINKTIILKR